MAICKVLNGCRLCGGTFYERTLVMKSTPLANELIQNREMAKMADRFPLEVVMCQSCKHVQLKNIVSAHRLFDGYLYRSGTSTFFVNHFRELAEAIVDQVPSGKYVLEIGSNDGTLLSELRGLGVKAIGIEPSKILASEAQNLGLEVIADYFDMEKAQEIKDQYGRPHMVIGNNVFAHIDNLKETFNAISVLLHEEGVFVFEVAHLLNILKDGIFDTIYHEHMSYHSVLAMLPFAEATGFNIVKVEKINPHGGSLRFWLSKSPNPMIDGSVRKIVEEEIEYKLDSPEIFSQISGHISGLRVQIENFLSKSTNTYFGYGAPAKVVTFLSEMGLEQTNIIAILEDNKKKQMHFLPGSGIPIKSRSEIELLIKKSEIQPEFNKLTFLIFPWNLGKELKENLKSWVPINTQVVTFFPTLNIELI